jgi:hypothetical protein
MAFRSKISVKWFFGKVIQNPLEPSTTNSRLGAQQYGTKFCLNLFSGFPRHKMSFFFPNSVCHINVFKQGKSWNFWIGIRISEKLFPIILKNFVLLKFLNFGHLKFRFKFLIDRFKFSINSMMVYYLLKIWAWGRIMGVFQWRTEAQNWNFRIFQWSTWNFRSIAPHLSVIWSMAAIFLPIWVKFCQFGKRYSGN